MKNRYMISIVAIIVVLSLMVGCSNAQEDKNSIENLDKITSEAEETNNETPITEKTDEEKNDSEKEEQSTEETGEVVDENAIVLEDGQLRSKLTGMVLTEEEAARRPFAVMLDNHYAARPQASLGDADIIFEILAEGRITRYMAVIQSKTPTWVGPVRSARPYFIDKALEFDSIYVHVGGSEQAKDDIKALRMAEVDGMSASAKAMWREKHKKIPHNMYSSTEGIRYEANRKKYRTNYDLEGYKFDLNGTDLEGDALTRIRIPYKKPTSTDKTGYTSEFRYDEASQKYLRYVNDKAYADEKTKVHLTADNVIVQYAKHKTIDDYGRRAVALIGTGNGYYITRGKYIPVTWEKKERSSSTKFFDSEGNEILFNVGVTWIQVVPDDMKINFN